MNFQKLDALLAVALTEVADPDERAFPGLYQHFACT